MTKEEIQAIVKEYIQNNLTVEVGQDNDYGSEYLVVSVRLDGELLSRDSTCIKRANYY